MTGPTQPPGEPPTIPPKRVPAGRLNGVHAEIGTVLGPKVVTREFVAVTGIDDQGVTVGYARTEDTDFPAIERMAVNPRSVIEAQMVMGYQVSERLRLRDLFGGAA